MRKLIIIITTLFIGGPLFAQRACTFKTPDNHPRHDQYSKSSKKNIEKSKEEMDEQAKEFDKKKYQAEVKGKNIKGKKGKATTKQKDKSVLRYY